MVVCIRKKTIRYQRWTSILFPCYNVTTNVIILLRKPCRNAFILKNKFYCSLRFHIRCWHPTFSLLDIYLFSFVGFYRIARSSLFTNSNYCILSSGKTNPFSELRMQMTAFNKSVCFYFFSNISWSSNTIQCWSKASICKFM